MLHSTSYGAFDGNMEDFHDDGAVAMPMALGRDNAFLLARGLAANTTLKVLAYVQCVCSVAML